MSQRNSKKKNAQTSKKRPQRNRTKLPRTPRQEELESRLDEAKRELKDNVAAMEVAMADEPERHPWWNRHGQAVVFGIGIAMILISIAVVNITRSNADAYEAQAKAATSALSVVKTQENATTYLASIGSKLTEAGEDSEGYTEIYEAGEALDVLLDSDYEYPTDTDASVSDFNDAYDANEKLLDDIEEKSTALSDTAKQYHADWFESDDDADGDATVSVESTEGTGADGDATVNVESTEDTDANAE